MTSSGPKLIEINGRMGGFYLREWIQHLYGVDLMMCALQVSSGVKPYIPLHPTNETLMGIMLIPSKHRDIWENKESRQSLLEMQKHGELIINMFRDEFEDICEALEEPFCNIAIRGKSVEDAKEKLLKLCERFEISCEGYNVRNFTSCFWSLLKW